MRMQCGHGCSDVRITSITRDRVLLENDEVMLNIPISEFTNMSKIIIKKSTNTCNKDKESIR